MKIEEAFKLYEQNSDIGTFKAHRGKIKKYIDIIGNIDTKDAFNEESLNKYIFGLEQKSLGKYSALKSLYDFIQEEINGIHKSKIIFPIIRSEVEAFENHKDGEKTKIDENVGTIFLDKKFKFTDLFNDKYYYHMQSKEAILTVKAAISLGLTAGYDSGDMFYNNTVPKMKLNDIEVNDEYVKVRNYNTNSLVMWIYVYGDLANYISDYYNLRKSVKNLPRVEQDIFFAKIWETRELKYEPSFENVRRKPYSVQELVLYFLKYISRELCLNRPLRITDLRYNMVLHSLYNSKGSSLKQIIKTFGYPPFVEEAFNKYCEEEANTDFCSLFNDNSFFKLTPLEEAKNSIEQSSNGDNPSTKQVIINQIVRDRYKVSQLKNLYNNACQICGNPLTLMEQVTYSECCHIQPVGGEHMGVDDKSNMLILCPNHHKIFDLGIITLDPEDMKTIIHVDKNNELNGKKLKIVKHNISPICVRYHYENIYMNLLKQLKGNTNS